MADGGVLSGPLLYSMIGAGAGAMLNRKKPLQGALMGGLLGAGGGAMVGGGALGGTAATGATAAADTAPLWGSGMGATNAAGATTAIGANAAGPAAMNSAIGASSLGGGMNTAQALQMANMGRSLAAGQPQRPMMQGAPAPQLNPGAGTSFVPQNQGYQPGQLSLADMQRRQQLMMQYPYLQG